MKPKWIKMYLDMAIRAAEESHAVRLKVGAIFVSVDGVMSMGINGLPEGGDNECEIREYMQPDAGGWLDLCEMEENWPYIDGTWETGHIKRYRLKTRPDVSHAEENVYSKMLRAGISAKGGTLFITHAPCINCSRQIKNSGTAEVFYANDYRDLDGVNYLIRNGVKVTRID